MSNSALKLLAASGAKAATADVAFVPFEDGTGGVQTIDISDPTNMSVIATLASSSAMTKPFGLKLDITNSRAFICCEDDSVAVIDVSNTSSPSITGALAAEHGLKYLDIDPTRDLVFGSKTGNPGGIRIYDVSDPTDPTQSGSSLSSAFIGTLGIANHRSRNLCFIVDDDAMYAFSTGATNPSQNGSTLSDSTNLNQAKAIKLDESNNIAFVAIDNGIASVNIANTSSMAILDTAQSTNAGDNQDIAIDLEAGLAFVTVGQYLRGGIMCFDISNPSSISLLDKLEDNTNLIGARGVAYDPEAKVAYVTCRTGGTDGKFTAVSASNTSSLSVLGSIACGKAAARFAINTTPREATNAEETS